MEPVHPSQIRFGCAVKNNRTNILPIETVEVPQTKHSPLVRIRDVFHPHFDKCTCLAFLFFGHLQTVFNARLHFRDSCRHAVDGSFSVRHPAHFCGDGVCTAQTLAAFIQCVNLSEQFSVFGKELTDARCDRFFLNFLRGCFLHLNPSMLIGVPTVPTLPELSVAVNFSPGKGYMKRNIR